MTFILAFSQKKITASSVSQIKKRIMNLMKTFMCSYVNYLMGATKEMLNRKLMNIFVSTN